MSAAEATSLEAPGAHSIASEGHVGVGYRIVCHCGDISSHKSRLYADDLRHKHLEDVRTGRWRPRPVAEQLEAARDEPWEREAAVSRALAAAGSEPTFALTDEGAADWALRKLQAAERRRAEIKAAADSEVARIEAWAAAEEARVEHDATFFEGLLADYMRRRCAADPKLRTHRLPHGELRRRDQAPEWDWRDAEAFIAWAESDDETATLVRVKKEPAKDVAKKALQIVGLKGAAAGAVLAVADSNGSPVPGLVAVVRPPKYSAVPTHEEDAS